MGSDLTYSDGFEGVVARWEERRAPISAREGERLPGLGVDLARMRVAVMPDPAAALIKPASPFAFKSHALAVELAGQSELAHLNAMLIAHLRRRAWPDHAPALFQRIWAEQSGPLLDTLNARWLVSSVITFADHGVNEAQRRTGHGLNMLFSMMKLYEFERSFSGVPADTAFRLGQRHKGPLPLEMDDFSLKSGGLDYNLLAPIWRDAIGDPVIAPLACHLLDFLNRDPGTLFRRLQSMRTRVARRAARSGGGS